MYVVLVSENEVITRVKDELGCCYGLLEEIEIPRESEMDGIEYMGPPINNPTSQSSNVFSNSTK